MRCGRKFRCGEFGRERVGKEQAVISRLVVEFDVAEAEREAVHPLGAALAAVSPAVFETDFFQLKEDEAEAEAVAQQIVAQRVQLADAVIARAFFRRTAGRGFFTGLRVQPRQTLDGGNWIDDRDRIKRKERIQLRFETVERAGLDLDDTVLIADIGKIPPHPDLVEIGVRLKIEFEKMVQAALRYAADAAFGARRTGSERESLLKVPHLICSSS